MVIFIVFSIFFYFLGSFPTSYLLGKSLYKIDILNKGSKHSGLSNIYKYSSRKIIFLILFIDIFLKGFIPSCIISNYFSEYIFSCIFLIIGHNWPFFLRLNGGKGLSVSIGILAGINIYVFFLLIIFFFVFWMIEQFKDSSMPWILSFFSTILVLIIDIFYFNALFESISKISLFSIIIVFLLLLFRRSLGNREYNSYNPKILFIRLIFDRDVK